MTRFCEDEGYDYNKFLQYTRHGQKEYSILTEADERQEGGGFIPLVVDGSPDRGLGVSEVRIRFTNGMDLTQGEVDIDKLLGMVRKMLAWRHGDDVKRVLDLPVQRQGRPDEMDIAGS